jgi:hypothetical protein
MFFRAIACCLLMAAGLRAQTVQPVIVEYTGKAEGKLTLTNNTDLPMAVVLEPMSFSIEANGRGVFRPLDAGIHLELSSMSARLTPRQTYYVFYSATATRLPAWFTVYATFSQVRHGDGLEMRIMLPHTVYLYQKQPLDKADVRLKEAVYSLRSHKLTCTFENAGNSLARVQQVKATGKHDQAEASGFPFLPGEMRRVEMDWDKASAPDQILVRFEHFTVKWPVNAVNDP